MQGNYFFQIIKCDSDFRWCQPCKLLAPRIESVVDEKRGKILLAKVDIDEMTDTALDYDVRISDYWV